LCQGNKLVEQLTYNSKNKGSSPTTGTVRLKFVEERKDKDSHKHWSWQGGMVVKHFTQNHMNEGSSPTTYTMMEKFVKKKKRNRLDSIFGSAKVAHWWNN
jgi:hypothetical protein